MQVVTAAGAGAVSVVIPAYKAASTIRRAVQSVLQQTQPPLEILVVDDGSPDREEAAELAGLDGPRTALVQLRKANGGRNFGLDRAAGEWIAFLDADDYWEPAKLERQLMAAQAHPESALIGSLWWEEAPGRPRRLCALSFGPYGRPLRHPADNAFLTALSLWTGTVMVRRSALANVRFDAGLATAEDRDVWCRLASQNTVYVVGEPLATYVQLATSLSNSDVDRDCASMLKVVERHGAVLGASGVREQTAVVHRRWAAGHLSRGQFQRALSPALRRLRLQPLSVEAWWVVTKSAVKSVLHSGAV